jgi:hypothetical protein
MSRRFRTWVIDGTIFASLVLFAAPSSADPVVITSGQVTMVTPSEGLDPPFGFGLNAPGLSFEASFFDFVGAFGQAGGLMNLSSGFAIQNPPPLTSTVVVNGTTYAGISPGGSLAFTAMPFLLGPGSDLATFQFETPFTMTGHLEGFSDPLKLTPPLFDVTVSGSGVANVTGIVHGNGADAIYLGQVVGYRFSPSPASTTPEPSSLMFCGMAGAALLIWRSRRRRVPDVS